MFRFVAMIAGFFSWWGHELVGLIPRWLRGLFVTGRKMLVVHMGEESVVIRRWVGGRKSEVFQPKEGDTPQRRKNAIRAAIRRFSPEGWRCCSLPARREGGF